MNNRRKLEKRLEALEIEFQSDIVILTMPDGGTRKLHSTSKHTMRLLASALSDVGLTPTEAADRELLRTAVAISGPHDSLLELAQAILNSPYTEPV